MTTRILVGDCREQLRTLPAESVHCCVTSPPYFGLRDYGVAGQIGLESTPEEYTQQLVMVFREVRRVLRSDGVLFLNLGDSYFGGGRGGNPPDSMHQKQQRTNRGSVSMPSSVRHVGACDMPDKEPEGSQEHDCFCQSLCDACRAAYQIGKSHSNHSRASMPPVSNFLSSREHTELQSDHPPTLGSTLRGDRSVDANQDQKPLLDHEPGQTHASVVSTIYESSRLPHVRHLEASTRGDECRLCGRSSTPDAHPCVCKTVDPCESHLAFPSTHHRTSMDGIASTAGASADHRLDTAFGSGAWTNSTTKSHPLKAKDLIGIPWLVAFALRLDGWYLRQDIIWSKPNPMPESVRDRCTKAHEYLFLLSKSASYYYDADAIAETTMCGTDLGILRGRKQNNDRNDSNRRIDAIDAGIDSRNGNPSGSRNKRSVWEVTTQPFSEAHFATFPPALIEPCILAGCPEGGTVIDPFGGAGTTGLVADRLKRNAILIELNPEYAAMARRRIEGECPMFSDVHLHAAE